MEKIFFSRKEISEVLNISISTVNRGYKKRIPPFDKVIKIGRRVIFPVSSIASLQNANKEIVRSNDE